MSENSGGRAAPLEVEAGSASGKNKEAPPAVSATNGSSNNYLQDANGINARGVRDKQYEQQELLRKEEVARKFREEQIKEAEERARARARELAAQTDAKLRADLEHDRRLIEEAKNNKLISLQAVKAARDKEIRDGLTMAAIAQQAREEIKEENKKTGLELAQLLQMAAVTMQAATAMNSVESASPGQNIQNFDPTKAVAPKAALVGRSPASLGDKKNTISEKALDSEATAEGEKSKDKSVKDKETLAKIKAAVEAAEKRKKIQAMRLKQKLRERANAQGKGAVDTDELFGGSLNQGVADSGGDASEQAEESAAKGSAMSVSSVYQAAKEGFSLAGAETDREVGQLVTEAERDLSSEDMSAGVLGRESPNLFARVHAVHQACQRQKCVLSLK